MPANENGKFEKGSVNAIVEEKLDEYYQCYVRYAKEMQCGFGK